MLKCLPSTIVKILYLTLFLIGCSTGAEKNDFELNGQFQEPNLTSEDVYKIDVHDDNVFVGTSSGFKVFDASTMENLGHFKKNSSVRTFIVVEADFWLISVAYPDGSEENAIFKSQNQGLEWENYTNNYGEGHSGERQAVPGVMDFSKTTAGLVLFARSFSLLNMNRSKDKGQSWEVVAGSWENGTIGTTRFVKIDENNSDNIWTGGAGSFFTPHLVKSKDGGSEWEFVETLENTENFVYDVSIRDGVSEQVLLAMNGVILKSTDFGDSWDSVYSASKEFYSFSRSINDPNIIYASGISASGQLFFLASNDFGDTWVLNEFSDGPTEIFVHDMASANIGGKEVLYFGTNKGIYTFEVEK